jgi:dTDP-4-dehydrorhamnose reductase
LTEPVRVLVLGASGMLGNAMLRLFARSDGYAAIGAVRTLAPPLKSLADGANFITGLDAESADSIARAFAEARPDVVINAVGLIKQLNGGNTVASAVPINTLLPHRLQMLAEIAGARLVHISTDCVFSGSKGGYLETDKADAADVYGLSKYLGEVEAPNAVTLRTSIIGHELASANGLIEWFLAQKHGIKGFTKAIFSGLPTIELARVVRDYVLPHPELTGLYHVSADPISKYDLLRLVSAAYRHDIAIEPDTSLVIDRSLNSDRFRGVTGYTPPSWPQLVETMKQSRIESQ